MRACVCVCVESTFYYSEFLQLQITGTGFIHVWFENSLVQTKSFILVFSHDFSINRERETNLVGHNPPLHNMLDGLPSLLTDSQPVFRCAALRPLVPVGGAPG